MNFRTRFQRFLLRNRDKGIPNLMLYIVLGNAVVSLMSMLHGGEFLSQLLYFDKHLILQGQVWRLFTFVFTQSSGGILGLIFLFFFYMLGRHVEQSMGTLRFNLFYLGGVILMDVFAMIFYPQVPEVTANLDEYNMLMSVLPTYWNMSYYLHLSLVLAFATTNPDARFLILYIIPVQARFMALLYLFLLFAEIFNLSVPILYFPHNLFPLVAVANYLLFMWRDIPNLIPYSWRIKRRRNPTAKRAAPQTGSIPFRPAKPEPADFSHKCTICGRTDKTNPELEFRYCSRCAGYHCYCQDHISNHEHIQ